MEEGNWRGERLRLWARKGEEREKSTYLMDLNLMPKLGFFCIIII
jgi:hypothetical protein